MRFRRFHSVRRQIKKRFEQVQFSLPALWLGYRPHDQLGPLPPSIFYKTDSPSDSLLKIHHQFLRQSGWIESRNTRMPVRNGEFIPWITYAAIYFLETIELKQFDVLEIGGGASTFYFEKRVSSLNTIELDDTYYHALVAKCLKETQIISSSDINCFEFSGEELDKDDENRLLKLLELDYQFNHIYSTEPIDPNLLIHFLIHKVSVSNFIFVDGGPRNLVLGIVAMLQPQAMVLVDNSDFPSLSQGMETLQKADYLEFPFRGLSPINPYQCTTSVFLPKTPEFLGKVFDQNSI